MKKYGKIVLLVILAAGLYTLTGCSSSEESKGYYALEAKVSESNQKGYDLMNEGKYDEAVLYFEQAIYYVYQLNPKLQNTDLQNSDYHVPYSELLDSPLNNLSWARNELGQYEESLELIEKALLIIPNSAWEHVNKGNALYGLNRSKEAMAQYDQAVDIDNESVNAYYGRGTIYYDEGKVEEALTQMNKVLELEPNDPDATETAIYAHLYLDQNEKAKALADEFMKKNPDDYTAYKYKGAVMENTADFEELKVFYEETGKKFKDFPEAQLKLGELYYDNEKYDLSLNYFTQLLKTYPNNIDIYIQLIKVNGALEDLKAADVLYTKAQKIDATSLQLHTAMGDAYMDNTYYIEAVPFYDRAIALDPANEDMYIKKLSALYRGKRNIRCVKAGEEAAKIDAFSSDIAWYTGKCNVELGHYEAAIDNFKEAVRIDPDDADAYSSIANAYLTLEDYEHAREYSAKSLEVDSENSQALYIKDELENKKKPLGEQISQFFSTNYLYKDNLPDRNQSLERLNKSKLSNPEIASLLEGVKRKDDRFTYTIYGEDYDLVTTEGAVDLESYKEDGSLVYFKIRDFNANTDDAFVEVLDRISDTPNKTLVIDLRDNGGGFTNSANNMLDVLLPSYVTSSLIYNDGYSDNYYSDASHIDFKHIFIFVDEHTASAAELLTLGLKSYLSNVTVVGRDTFGKGVGQLVFEDKKERILVFVVNHYWNVKQNNVMNSPIKPDIAIKGNSLENFMKPVNKTLK